MEPRYFHGPEVNPWRGISLSLTRTPSPTYTTLCADQEPQQTRRLRTRSQSIVISPSVTFSSQSPLKRLEHGTRWLLSWFRKLAGGSQWSLRTPGRQHYCVLVSALVHCSSTWKYDLLPQHVHCHRINTNTHCSRFFI